MSLPLPRLGQQRPCGAGQREHCDRPAAGGGEGHRQRSGHRRGEAPGPPRRFRPRTILAALVSTVFLGLGGWAILHGRIWSAALALTLGVLGLVAWALQIVAYRAS